MNFSKWANQWNLGLIYWMAFRQYFLIHVALARYRKMNKKKMDLGNFCFQRELYTIFESRKILTGISPNNVKSWSYKEMGDLFFFIEKLNCEFCSKNWWIYCWSEFYFVNSLEFFFLRFFILYDSLSSQANLGGICRA